NCTQTLSGLTSTCTVLVPFSGSNTVECGQNVRLMDHAGEANPSVNANGYTVLEAGEESVINISGTYNMYYYDALRIYDGVGTSGTLLQSFTNSYSGNVNYTGDPGQTLTVLFDSYSSSSSRYAGFDLDVTYTGLCEYDCDAPTVSSEILADCSADTFDVTISFGDDGDAEDYLVSYSVNSGDTLEVGTFEGGSIDVLIGSFVTNDLVDVIITHPTDENCTQTLSGLTS